MQVLAPPESLPHITAAVALARYTDDLCGSGPAEGRTQRFEEWADRVGMALETVFAPGSGGVVVGSAGCQ
jgi:hypothetical protein